MMRLALFIAVGLSFATVAGAARKDAPGAKIKREQFVHPFKCDGSYGSHTCDHTLYLNNCKDTIRIQWHPLKYPGSQDFKKKRHTWCSVTWTSSQSVEERKYQAPLCEQVMSLIGSAVQGFPEVKWQDTPCTHLGSSDGVLYTKQYWEKPTKPLNPPKITGAPAAIERPADYKDPEPVAVALEDLRTCVLENPMPLKKKLGINDQTPVDPKKLNKTTRRVVRCPVLQQNVHSWLRKFLAKLDVFLSIQNEWK